MLLHLLKFTCIILCRNYVRLTVELLRLKNNLQSSVEYHNDNFSLQLNLSVVLCPLLSHNTSDRKEKGKDRLTKVQLTQRAVDSTLPTETELSWFIRWCSLVSQQLARCCVVSIQSLLQVMLHEFICCCHGEGSWWDLYWWHWYGTQTMWGRFFPKLNSDLFLQRPSSDRMWCTPQDYIQSQCKDAIRCI